MADSELSWGPRVTPASRRIRHLRWRFSACPRHPGVDGAGFSGLLGFRRLLDEHCVQAWWEALNARVTGRGMVGLPGENAKARYRERRSFDLTLDVSKTAPAAKYVRSAFALAFPAIIQDK